MHRQKQVVWTMPGVRRLVYSSLGAVLVPLLAGWLFHGAVGWGVFGMTGSGLLCGVLVFVLRRSLGWLRSCLVGVCAAGALVCVVASIVAVQSLSSGRRPCYDTFLGFSVDRGVDSVGNSVNSLLGKSGQQAVWHIGCKR